MDRPTWAERRQCRTRRGDAAGLPEIDIAVRDADVPLSRLGEEQSLRARPVVRRDGGG